MPGHWLPATCRRSVACASRDAPSSQAQGRPMRIRYASPESLDRETLCCHCEERSDEAIPIDVRTSLAIASSLRS
jgi:hypothetical protein